MFLTSCQAENSEPVARAIAGYLSRRLHVQVNYVEDIEWPERYRRLDEGTIEIGWICGLPYVQRANGGNTDLELLAAPVMRGERYQNQPVYFSDVVVRCDAWFQKFVDLRGAKWAYNEPNSQSGYGVISYYLSQLETDWRFFGELVESGGHKHSLDMILDGTIDGTAIDSTYLEWRIAREPALGARIRIIDSFGPSPIPPWVVSSRIAAELRLTVRSLLLGMAEDAEGREILREGELARFVAISDRDYDPIRKMMAEKR